MNNDYIKVIYQTPPIEDENIILELTTFDLEKYKRDQKLIEINKVRVMAKSCNMNQIYLTKQLIDDEIIQEHKRLIELIKNQELKIERLQQQIEYIKK